MFVFDLKTIPDLLISMIQLPGHQGSEATLTALSSISSYASYYIRILDAGAEIIADDLVTLGPGYYCLTKPLFRGASRTYLFYRFVLEENKRWSQDMICKVSSSSYRPAFAIQRWENTLTCHHTLERKQGKLCRPMCD